MSASPPPGGELDPLTELDAAFHASAQRSDSGRRLARPRGEVKRVRSQSRCSTVHKLLRSFTARRQQPEDGRSPLQAAGQEQPAPSGGSTSSSSRPGSAPRYHSPHPAAGSGGGGGGSGGGIEQLLQPAAAAAHHHHSHHHHGRRSAKAKQRAMQKARAFKDLDMTIELLGIDSSSSEQQQLLSHMSLPLSLSGRLASLGLLNTTAASPGWATPTASQAHTPPASVASLLQPTAAPARDAATAAAAAGATTSSSSDPLRKVQSASALAAASGAAPASSAAPAADGRGSGSSYLAAAKRTVSFKQPAAPAAAAWTGRPRPQQQQPQPSVLRAPAGQPRGSSTARGAHLPPAGLPSRPSSAAAPVPPPRRATADAIAIAGQQQQPGHQRHSSFPGLLSQHAAGPRALLGDASAAAGPGSPGGVARVASLARRAQGSPFSRRSSSGAATPPSGLGAPAAGGSGGGGEGGAARPPLHAAPSLAGSDRLSERLAQDRAALQCALHNVLDGGPALEGPDDVATALADAQGRADELASELAGLLPDVAAAEDWRARELLLGAAEDAFKRAKLITKDLRSHLPLVESLGRASAYHHIIATCTPAIVALVAALASNVSGGIAPHLQQPPPQQQQQQEQQEPLLQQQELLWRCQQAIDSSTAAAVRTAAVGSAGSDAPAAGAAAAAAAPFPGGEDEVRAVFKMLRRLLELIKDVEARCRTNSQQAPALVGVCSAATWALQDAACRLMTAALAAAAYEQAGLLLPTNLGPSVGHKVSSRARLVTVLWRFTHDLFLKVGKAFDVLRPLCLLLLMQLLTAAATAAINMQKRDMRAAAAAAAAASGDTDADAAAGGSDSDGSSTSTSSIKSDGSSTALRLRHRRSCSGSSYGVVSAGPRSALGDISASDSDDAWSLETTLDRDSFSTRGDADVAAPLGLGSRDADAAGSGARRGAGRRGGRVLPPVTDAQIQQQAWLPQVLHMLCHGSSAVAKQVVEALTASESYVDAGLPPLLTVESEEALSDSLEDLQEAWYWLVLTNTRRCARLTAAPGHASPEGLALWALEILRTTAAGALKLVQDYDNSALGLGQALEGIDEDQGLRLFKSLKRATDANINGLLRVQQLLKLRRIEADAAPPASPQHQQHQAQLQQQQQQQAQVQQQQQQRQQQQRQQQPPPPLQQHQQAQQQRLTQQQPRRVAERWELAQPQQPRPPSSQHAGAGSGQRQPQPGGTNGFADPGSSRWPGARQAAPGGPASRGGASSAGSSPRPQAPRWHPAQGLGFSPPDSSTAADSLHAAVGTQGHSFSGWMPEGAERSGTRPSPMLSPDSSESPRASPPTAILGTTPTAGNIWTQRMQQQQQQPSRGSASAAPAPALAAGSAAAATTSATTSPARVSPFGAAAAEASPFSPVPVRQPWAGSEPPRQQQQQLPRQQQQQQHTGSGGAGGGSSAQSAPRSFRDVLAAGQAAGRAAGTLPSAPGGSTAPSEHASDGPSTPSRRASPFEAGSKAQGGQRQPRFSAASSYSSGMLPGEPSYPGQQPRSGASGVQQPGTPQTPVSPGPSAGGAAAAGAAEQQQQHEAGSSFGLLSGGTPAPLTQDLAVAACVLGGPHAQQALLQQQQQLPQDASAAADALAAAERQGGSSAHAVLPAALAILRMIQASEDIFWKVRWADLEGGLLRKLGSGSYGQVYQGVYLNAQVAIKVLNSIDSTDGLSAETLLRFKAEVDFQRKLSHHPNVVRFIGACCELPAGLTDALAEAASSAAAAASSASLAPSGALSSAASASASSSTASAWPSRTPSLAAGSSSSCVPPHLARGVKLAIVMELCQLGSLFSMIGQARRVRTALADGHQSPAELRRQLPYGWQFYSDWLTRLDVLRGAAAGLEFMHTHGVIHRDLTSYNLLLDWGRPWQAKVCDFNLSRMQQAEAVNNSGNPNSPAWQSPEILGGECYSTATDVFSFAVVMWEVLTLLEPWREETEGADRPQLYFIMSSVGAGGRLALPEAHELQQQGQPGLNASLASALLALMQRCWAQQPAERPCMGEVAGQLSQLVQRLRDERRAAAAAARTQQGGAA